MGKHVHPSLGDNHPEHEPVSIPVSDIQDVEHMIHDPRIELGYMIHDYLAARNRDTFTAFDRIVDRIVSEDRIRDRFRLSNSTTPAHEYALSHLMFWQAVIAFENRTGLALDLPFDMTSEDDIDEYISKSRSDGAYVEGMSDLTEEIYVQSRELFETLLSRGDVIPTDEYPDDPAVEHYADSIEVTTSFVERIFSDLRKINRMQRRVDSGRGKYRFCLEHLR